jgi:hypothetical protein
VVDAGGKDAGGPQDGAPQVFMALPGPDEDGTAGFLRSVADVVRVIGLDADTESVPDGYPQVQGARRALRELCREGVVLPAGAFDVLVAAAVRDPNPSFNRGFVEPALNAFGRRRLRAALFDVLTTGSDPERAGAARAWYWSALPLRMPRVVAEGPAGADEPDDPSVLGREWNELALREFVRNEHLDVRRCILPLLPLRHRRIPRSCTNSWTKLWRSPGTTPTATSAIASRSRPAHDRGAPFAGAAGGEHRLDVLTAWGTSAPGRRPYGRRRSRPDGLFTRKEDWPVRGTSSPEHRAGSGRCTGSRSLHGRREGLFSRRERVKERGGRGLLPPRGGVRAM